MAYEKTGEEGDTWNTMYEIEELNERFNILMDQCSKETCRRTRNLIRGKLAETAQKMRNFKKEFNLENWAGAFYYKFFYDSFEHSLFSERILKRSH